MSALWAWFLGTRVGRWIVGVGAVVGALAVALLVAFVKGEHRQTAKDTVKDAEAEQRAVQAAADAVKQSSAAVEKTNADLSKMPDVGTQTVGDAAPDSAAGWLREHADRDQAGS